MFSMVNLFFNLGGTTHSLRLREIDQKPDEISVWEGLVDGSEYVFFEAKLDPFGDPPEVWELFELAIESYLNYTKNTTTEVVVQTRWKDE